MFHPPLSPGLLWNNAYIYSKSNPHKIVTNLTQKIRFWKILSRKIGHRIPPFRRQFFTNQKPPTGSQNRTPNSTNRALILVFQQTSILHSKLQFGVTSTTVLELNWNNSVWFQTVQFGSEQFGSILPSKIRVFFWFFIYFFQWYQ